MKLAFSTLGLPEGTLEEAIGLVREFSFQALELRALEGRLDLPLLFAERYGTPEVLSHYLREQAASVIVIDTSAILTEQTPESRAEILDLACWADGIGTPYLRVFDGGSRGNRPTETDFRHMSKFLEWWQQEKQRLKIKAELLVETHDTLLRAEDILTFCQRMPGSVGVLWDAHHTFSLGGEAPELTWERCARYIRHIHVKDSLGLENGQRKHVAPGEGDFPLRALLHHLESSDYNGFVSLEMEKQWRPELPHLREALQRGRDHALW